MQKKIPMRRCVGCRVSRPKRELIRVVCSAEGRVELDTTGRLPGRGAYVCPSAACLEKAIKSRALERAFADKAGHGVKPGEAMLEALRQRIAELERANGEGGGAQ